MKLRSGVDKKLYDQEGLILEVTEEICRVMHRKKVTKAELAVRVGCGKSHMTQLLNGGRNMTLRTLSDIASALECEPIFRLTKIQQKGKEGST